MLIKMSALLTAVLISASVPTLHAALSTSPQVVDGWDVYQATSDTEGSSSVASCPTVSNGKKIKIVGGSPTSKAVLRDFQCLYNDIGTGGFLHLENIRLQTDSVNGYALYTKETIVTMKNVEIDGYSGCRDGQSIDDGTCTETGGGAMRVRGADYGESGHNAASPSLSNVHVTNCCRGFRIQDSKNIYVKDCTATNVSDNAFYFASGSYKSTAGCEDSTFDTCHATNAGQTGFMNIGGNRNVFKNIQVDKSRGVGFYNYNSNGETTIDTAVFTNANTKATTTGWNGAADDGEGAAIAMTVESGDTAGVLNAYNLVVKSGGVTASEGKPSVVFYNNQHGRIRVYCSFDYTASNFEGGLVHGATTSDTFSYSSTKVEYDCYQKPFKTCGDAKSAYKTSGCCGANDANALTRL